MSLFVKFHLDHLDDAAIRRAVRNGAKELVNLPWLLAFAKKADDGGRLTIGGEPAEAVDIAPSIPGATAKTVDRAIRELVDLCYLIRDDDGALRFADWERQAGKPSDAPSQIAERVRKHRAKQALPVTPSNALQVTLRNATEREREVERDEEREREAEGPTAAAFSSPAVGPLPPCALELLDAISDPQKRVNAEREMRHALNGGTVYRGQRIRSTREKLDAKCRDTLTANGRSPVRGLWAYTLTKLADTSDGSAPGAVAGVHDEQERASQNVESADRERRADEFLGRHPEMRDELYRKAITQFPGPVTATGFVETARKAWINQQAWNLLKQEQQQQQ